MSNGFHFILDDRELATPPSSDLIGHRAFGDVVFRRSRLHARIAEAVSGVAGVVFTHARTDAELLAASSQTARDGAWGVVWRASAVGRDRASFIDLLERLRLAEQQVVLGAPRAIAVVAPGAALQAAAHDPWSYARDWPVLAVADTVADLTDARDALRFLSGGFDARHFNAVHADDATVTKGSHDVEKISAEHDYHYLLPASLRRWFVAPTNLQVTDDGASYQMERHYVADAALLWCHGALSVADFGRLMDETFAFLDARPVRPVSAAAATAMVDALYLEKVEQRIATLEADPRGVRLNGLLAHGTAQGSLRAIVARYRARFAQHRRALSSPPTLAIGHGDLCLSNMLFQREGAVLRLIDPRGARTDEALWMHPGYDLAKLSHSVLGDYDWITSGRYRVVMGHHSALTLEMIDGGVPLAPLKEAFVARLEARAVDPRVLRTCEVSLFLSMLPLHIEHPTKLLALALNAVRILDELDANA